MNTPHPTPRLTMVAAVWRALHAPAPARRRATRTTLLVLLGLGLGLAGGAGQAATADISQVPVGTASTTAKPNVMFILDDSGSMNSAFMPEDMASTSAFGYYSKQCNGLAFDPTFTYLPPIKADGSTRYADASYPNALDDGYGGTATTDLSATTNNFYYDYVASTKQPALSWTYLADGTLLRNAFANECLTTISAGSTAFELKTIAPAQQQNYANWWSYYRKRYLLMRTSVGEAFATLNENYRVGFTVISDTTTNSGTNGKFVDTKDYNQTQRDLFYSRLYSASPGGRTPLRGALSKVGRYYSKPPGQNFDPAAYEADANGKSGLYQCQRNYALLSTDGYWNTQGFTAPYSTGFQKDGLNLVGEQDGSGQTPAVARPQLDSQGSTLATRTFQINQTNRISVSTSLTVKQTYTRNTYAQRNGGNCVLPARNYRVQPQTATQTSTGTQTTVYDTIYQSTAQAQIVNGNLGPRGAATTPVELAKANRTAVGPATDNITTSGAINFANNGATSNQCFSPAPTSPSAATPSGLPNKSVGTTETVTITSQGTPADAGFSDSTAVVQGGDADTLADIAQYYYMTDLRPDISGVVKPLGRDTATWQHMTTYTIGLGVQGTLKYVTDYLTNTDRASSDYPGIIDGSKLWPVPIMIANPNASDGNATHVDDLWHAAVNGRGQYFSAGNAKSLSNAITATLSDIKNAEGTGAGASASALTPTPTDNWVFLTRYATRPTWNGELRAYKFKFDASGRVVLPNTLPVDQGGTKPEWTVQEPLDKRDIVAKPRKIIFNSGSGLTDFDYTNLSTAQKVFFDNRCPATAGLMKQCDLLRADTANVTALLAIANSGDELVKFLKGDNTYKIDGKDLAKAVWRARVNRLGDISHSSPAYVAAPDFRYTDAGYSTFAAAKSGRDKVVYVGANDGMLHAFMVEPSATNITDKPGDELWAFIPQAVLPDLWRLADTRFEDDHHYYVDATPTVGDVFNSTTQTWRTILVGGLGAGGRSVFALDITDTSKPPVLLWEFTHADLGLTFGSPVITKNKAGTWVVAFSSGYNNTNDGLGRLFVLNAIDGTSLPGTPIATTAGNAGTPSNLGPVNAWVEKETDNTALRFYAGDMQGYLWRFDLDDLLPPSSNPAKPDAVALGRAMTPGTISVPQPITSRPLLSEVPLGSKLVPLISFGTGRYLGDTDVVNEDVQSMYTIKDTLGATGLGVLNSAAANLVKITLNDARTPTATASTPINWDAQNGWYADLDMTSAKRERVYLDATPVASGIIGYASLIPDADACSPGGTSWFYEFDITTGGLRQATFYSVPITGDSRVNDVDGTRALITDQEGIGKSPDGISNLPTPGTVIRRSSWRELLD